MQGGAGMPGGSPVNTGDPELEYAFYVAERRVLEIQAKLHRWAAMILIAGSMTCSTSSPTPRSCWSAGAGCGATRARRPPGWTAIRPLH